MSDEYIERIANIRDRFEEFGDVEDFDDAQELSAYIDKLEKMMDDIHRVTEFASDYNNTWRGMLAEEY